MGDPVTKEKVLVIKVSLSYTIINNINMIRVIVPLKLLKVRK